MKLLRCVKHEVVFESIEPFIWPILLVTSCCVLCCIERARFTKLSVPSLSSCMAVFVKSSVTVEMLLHYHVFLYDEYAKY